MRKVAHTVDHFPGLDLTITTEATAYAGANTLCKRAREKNTRAEWLSDLSEQG